MKCEFQSKNTVCHRKKKHELDGMALCGMHYNALMKQQECSICFSQLKAEKNIKLACGHFFHTHCLSKCCKRECPLCRKRMCPDDCYEVFQETIIKPLTKWVFTFQDSEQFTLFNTFNHLITLNQKSEWLCRNFSHICQRFHNTNLNFAQMEHVLRQLEDTMKLLETNSQ